MTQEVKFISITMNWQGALPMLIAVLQSGDAEGREFAKKELHKLAKGMDDSNKERAKFETMVMALVKIAAKKSPDGQKLSPVCMANIAAAALAEVKGE